MAKNQDFFNKIKEMQQLVAHPAKNGGITVEKDPIPALKIFRAIGVFTLLLGVAEAVIAVTRLVESGGVFGEDVVGLALFALVNIGVGAALYRSVLEKLATLAQVLFFIQFLTLSESAAGAMAFLWFFGSIVVTKRARMILKDIPSEVLALRKRQWLNGEIGESDPTREDSGAIDQSRAPQDKVRIVLLIAAAAVLVAVLLTVNY